MSDDTKGMTVFLVMTALITAMLVYGCQFNRNYDLKRDQACWDATKDKECWRSK